MTQDIMGGPAERSRRQRAGGVLSARRRTLNREHRIQALPANSESSRMVNMYRDNKFGVVVLAYNVEDNIAEV
jgi:hypothetical protein